MTYHKKYYTSIALLGIETIILGIIFLSVYTNQAATSLDVWLYNIFAVLAMATFIACIYFRTAAQHEDEKQSSKPKKKVKMHK